MERIKSSVKSVLATLLIVSIVNPPQSFAADEKQILASVNGKEITMTDYHIMLRNESRQRFYHGKPSESQEKAFQREIADTLVDQALLIVEAGKRGIREDDAAVERRMKRYIDKAKEKNVIYDEKKPIWKALKERVAKQNIVEQLKASIDVDYNPEDSVVYQYYSKNPQLFTEPQRLRVSTILLKIPPSSPAESWSAAREEAARIITRIRKGENFSELAKLHSADGSAKNGGDMGYIHEGMLSEGVQKALNGMQPGDISEPLTVLEGIAIIKLDDRIKSSLNKYENVRERAKELWVRSEGQRKWNQLLDSLRKNAVIKKGKFYPEGVVSEVDKKTQSSYRAGKSGSS